MALLLLPAIAQLRFAVFNVGILGELAGSKEVFFFFSFFEHRVKEVGAYLKTTKETKQKSWLSALTFLIGSLLF